VSEHGKWVIVPGNQTLSGKPERRFQMKSGQYRETEPFSDEWNDAMYGQPARNAMGGIRDFMNGLALGTGILLTGKAAEQKEPARKPVPNRVPPDPRYTEDELRLAAAAEESTPVVRPLLSDDASARESALTAMRQQYMPGASIWGTDDGKKIMQAATKNQYTDDAAGLADYYTNQQRAGQGGIEEIISSMGYEGDMAKWARANQGLALREYNKKMASEPAPYATADNQVITTAEDGTQRIGEGMYGYVPELDGPPSAPGEVREANNNQTAELQGKRMYDRTLALLQAAQRGN
jgi:hypothetical protein